MQLHNLSIKNKKEKRVARGGKRGTTSGRGQKGQKSRSGHRIRPAQRDLLIRIPKLRGYKNKPKSKFNLVLSLAELEKISAKGGSASGGDILVTVGQRSKFIADAAAKKGIPIKNIFNFETADDAKIKIQEIIKKGDLILVKGSHVMELDKVVEEIRIV